MDSGSRVVFAVIMIMACMGTRANGLSSITAPNTLPSGNISRANCGTTQLCAAQPAGCNPSVSGSCFFVSTSLISGQNFSFHLQGQSSGYVAVGLSRTIKTGQNDSVYVCANINNTVNFSSTLYNNGVLTHTNTQANLVMGSVSGQTIRCIFSATVPNATSTKSSSTSFFLSIYNGTLTNGLPSIPKAVFISTAPVDLSNPTAIATNSLYMGIISRANCGTTQFCAAQPAGCNPSVSGSCFFVSTILISGQNFYFQLQGQSSGYVAVLLSKTTTTGQYYSVYVCANINNTFKLFSIIYNNGTLTPTNTLPSNLVTGSVSGQTIQCIFSALVPNATSTKKSTSFFISIYNGTVTNGLLGSPNAIFTSTAAVDLSNPNATATNRLTSASPNAFGLQRTLSQALPILLGGLVFIMM
ncbi:putative ferric-chelate reductase 1 [Esox lucius]|uniref:putative ferric-chelate reductase 1 n=1 Tax=Esox lucius TaxID=8010 RepID=UPI0014771179|nr:putative ferric-chelate reductase 1 [Esox lucius]